MRILMVTQWFDPEPAFKGLVFAKALRERGHEVEVLTGFPNYPGGKVYPGYRIRPFQREVMDGIPVLRVPLYPSHDQSPVGRALNYLSFGLSASILGSPTVSRADVMYVYHAPATIGLPAVVIGQLRRIPFVYDINDLWPDTLDATGMLNGKAPLWMIDRWCRFVYRRAGRVVVVTPGFKAALCARGVSEEKIEVIYNWCDERQAAGTGPDEALARDLGMAGRFNVVFAGTMGKAQALDSVLEAAGIVAERLPAVQFVFVGGGIEVERLKKSAVEKGLPNVLFLPRRPVSEIGRVLDLADVLLVHLKDSPLFRITIPSKVQTYLAIGRPILLGVRGDAENLVTAAKAGIPCQPESPLGIAQTVEEFFRMPRQRLREMGENGARYYRENLSLSMAVGKFEDVFRAVSRV